MPEIQNKKKTVKKGKKDMAKKIITLLLVLLLTLTAVSACANGNKNEATTPEPTAAVDLPTSGEEATSGDPVDVNGFVLDKLPETMNFDQDFNIFTWNNSMSWEWTENYETTGDAIKDSIVKRQTDVEERFGVRIKVSGIPGEWENRNNFINAVVASLNAGAGDEYDLIGQYSFSSAIGTVRGCYVNLKDIRYLDFNSPWWPNDIVDSCVINGKVYFTAGDISCTLIRNMQPILTNLDLAESLKCDNFYDLVRNQDWTAEKFMTYAYGTVTGLNPDGSEPCTTTLPNNVCYDNVFYAGGFKYVDITAEGPKMSESLESNNLTDWYDLWYSFVHDHSDVAVNKAINSENGFTTGNVLFHFGSIGDVQNYLQDITFKFGILPFPKYDKNQENYRTICGAWVSYYSIPTNAPDMDMSGAILEALGSYGYRVITPAVYTISFQYRFLNSQENAEVFELLHDTLVFDLGRQLGDQLNCFAAFRQAAQDTNPSWNGYYKGQQSAWSRALTKIVSNPALQ